MPLRFSVIILILVLSACTRHAYYQSPFHTNNQPYRTIPLQSDSTKSAWYGSVLLFTGRANDRQQDKVKMLSLSTYRTHSLRNFSAYYGISGGPGVYTVEKYNDSLNYSFDPAFINKNAGRKFFGGVGLIAGANLVIPFHSGGEFRFGLESAVNREFGDYLNFRKKIPDSSVNVVNRRNSNGTIAFGFDLIGRSRGDGSRFGWKQNFVWSMNRIPHTREAVFYNSNHFSTVFHYTKKKISLFVQFNAGAETISMQGGVNLKGGAFTKGN